MRTAFYLAYPDGKRLHAIEGAGDMDPAYTAPLNGFPVSHDSFCSGYAMATGHPVHTPDVFQDPLWQPYLPMATVHGFRAASSYPILTRQGKAIGSLALYFPHIHQATAQEEVLAKAITQAAALLLAPDTQNLEHTRAEEALRQSEAKYRTLFDSIDEGVAIVEVFPDEHGRVTDMIWREANPSVERQAGMGGWVGRRANEIVPHLEQAWLDAMTGVYQTGEPVRMEAYIADLDRWIETYYSRVGEAGSPLMVSVFRNITERKQREQHQEFLLRLSDNLRAESDAEAIGTIATRMVAEQLQADRCYIAHLPKGEGYGSIGSEYKATGLPPLRGEYRFADFPDAMKRIETGPLIIRDVFNEAGLSETDKQAIGHAMGLQGMLAAVLRKGERNHFWCLTAATLTPRNWTDHHVEFLEDVAERIWIAIERAKAGEALKKSEAKYRTLFNSIDEGFCIMELIYDRAGKPVDSIFHEVNPAFEPATGLQNAVGKSITELVPGIEVHWFEIYDKVIKTGEPVRFESYNEETQSWYSAYASRIGTAGTQLAVIFNNVTEHKQREQEQALLVTLGDRLRPLTDPVTIEGEVTQVLRAHFDAGWCYYVEWEEATKLGVVRRDATRKGLTSLVGEHDVSDVPEFLELLKANPLLAVSDYEHYERLTPALRQRYTSLGFRSMLVATLVKQEGLVASVLIGDTKIRQWSPPEQALLMQVTERIWAAVERAKAETALRQSEEYFRLLVTASSDSLYRMSADWSQMLNLKGMNFLTDTHQANTHWLARYIPLDEQPRVQLAIHQAIQTKQPF
ncbi:GAF domain-containing protein [Spirosoma linguale]|uniref:GAF domain-containing protein n=1 Tax=Spirosoma linguale TaxID=108 RepID=UPI003CC7C948